MRPSLVAAELGRSPALARRGLKSAAELAAARPHGDRLRYIAGCRCDDCRRANTAYERSRAAARRAGEWNGLVPAGKARAHMLWLSSQGVGRQSVAAASDISASILTKIRSGERIQIRALTERAILAVTPAAAADRALIDAGPTWKLIAALVRSGFTKARIARELGQQGQGLQLGRNQVTARNAYQVERLHARLIASDEAVIDAGPTWRRIAELRTECFTDKRIAREIGFDDGELHIGKRRISRALANRVEETYRRLMS